MTRLVAMALALTLAATGAGTAAPARPARNGSLPAVSPDGKRIAFGADRGDSVWQIYVVNVDGSGALRLTDSREEKNTPSWSADGKEVLYLSDRGDTVALCAIPREGGASRVISALEAKGTTLSHDGQRIAYTVGAWMRNRIMVGAVDGSGATAITDSSAGYFNLAWSPDDRLIAVTRRDTSGDLQVWVMGQDGGNAHALTRFAPGDGRPQWPAWSYDGRKVAIQAGVYKREDAAKNTAHIWVVDVATGAATKLAPHREPRLDETPSWFPDGKRLAFQSDRTGRMEIWVMNADGTHARQVTR